MAFKKATAFGVLALSVGFVASPASAGTKKNKKKDAAEAVGSAFGTMPDSTMGDEGPAAEAATEQEQALTALGSLGSFPIKMHNGAAAADAPVFTTEASDGFVPTPPTKRFKVGTCSFEIKTGALSARQYGLDARGKYTVLQDALATQSTLPAGGDAPVLVSVTTELFATPLDGAKDACKALLKDKRKRMGKVDLADTAASLVAADGKHEAVGAARAAEGTLVFLTWDDADGGLKLVDKAGLAPSVESAIYELKAETKGDLYLDVQPKLGVRRVGATVAGR